MKLTILISIVYSLVKLRCWLPKPTHRSAPLSRSAGQFSEAELGSDAARTSKSVHIRIRRDHLKRDFETNKRRGFYDSAAICQGVARMLAGEGHSFFVAMNTAGFMAVFTGNGSDVDVDLFTGEILRLVGHESVCQMRSGDDSPPFGLVNLAMVIEHD
jgi:hypothetical protein